VFLIDVNDRERFPESKRVLDQLLEQPLLQQVPIVLLGNKMDIPGCANEAEVRSYFNFQVRAWGRCARRALPLPPALPPPFSLPAAPFALALTALSTHPRAPPLPADHWQGQRAHCQGLWHPPP
jgi:hypothetical protein